MFCKTQKSKAAKKKEEYENRKKDFQLKNQRNLKKEEEKASSFVGILKEIQKASEEEFDSLFKDLKGVILELVQKSKGEILLGDLYFSDMCVLVYKLAFVASSESKDIISFKSENGQEYFDWPGFFQEMDHSTQKELNGKIKKMIGDSFDLKER